MATILLSAAGNALLPGVGGVVGGVIGGAIDNAFLFPPPDTKGPRIDDLKFQSGAEGSPINLVLATERVAGTVIWKSKLIEHEEDQGKGGGPSATTYTYSVDCAVGICHGPIHRVAKIIANGTVLYDADADVTITSNQIAVVKTTVRDWSNTLGAFVDRIYMDLSSPSGGPDLSRLRSGKNAVLSGFAAGGNNGTFRVLSSSKDATSGNSTARLRNINVVTASSGASVTIFQDLPEFSSAKLTGITFYTGTETQAADALIEAYEGTGNVPGFRGLAYVVLEGFQLGDFGNAMPQLQFIVEEVSGSKTNADAILALLARGARPSTDFDVTGVTGNLRGYNVRGSQSIAQALRPILLAQDIVTQQKGGVLHFISRTAAEVVDVEAVFVGAREEGQESPRPVNVTKLEKTSLPIKVNVTYVDTATDNQRGAQTYRGRRITAASDNVMDVDLPVVLTASEAQDRAKRFFWTAHANRAKVEVKLPPSLMTIQENDRLRFTAGGRDYDVLVGRVDRGVNGLLELECVTEEDDPLTFTGSAAASPSFTTKRVYTTPEMELVLIDMAPLSISQEEQPGLTWAAALLDKNVEFQGGGVYVSDDDTTYALAEPIAAEANMGRATTALGSSGISTAYWDRKSTVQVTLYGGELVSRAEIDVLNGANVAMLGREIVAFATATLQGDGSYILSNLIRGMFGTESEIATHVTGESFVLLTGPGIKFRALAYSDIDRTRYFKAVALGGIVSQFDAAQHVQECNTLRHFEPCHLRAARDSSNDATISWTRRTRSVFRLLGTASAPLLDTAEAYEVEIWDAGDTTLLRTITVSAATSTVYTSAMQIENFGSVQTSIRVRVYQVHSITGRSRAAHALV